MYYLYIRSQFKFNIFQESFLHEMNLKLHSNYQFDIIIILYNQILFRMETQFTYNENGLKMLLKIFSKEIRMKEIVDHFEPSLQSIEFIPHSLSVFTEDVEEDGSDNSVEVLKDKKKKKRRRRKKNKKTQTQDCITFEKIYQKIYTNHQTFESLKTDILKFIMQTPNENKFVDILNESVANYIKSIKFQIDKYQIKLIKPTITIRNQKSQQYTDYYCPEFCIFLIYKLYEEFENIKESSLHLQKIINLYFEYYQKCRKSFVQNCKYLDNDTYRAIFKKLVTDYQEFQQFMIFCNKFGKNDAELEQKDIIIKLKEMLQVFNYTPPHHSANYQEVIKKSTNSNNTNSRSNTSKKKNLEMDKQLQYNNLLQKLQNLKLQKNRVKCEIDENWIEELEFKRCRTKLDSSNKKEFTH